MGLPHCAWFMSCGDQTQGFTYGVGKHSANRATLQPSSHHLTQLSVLNPNELSYGQRHREEKCLAVT